MLNTPITLFEIFPFIFLLTTQFLFYDLLKKDELNLLRKSGLSNLKIIKILFLLALTIGIFNVAIYYNLASKLKFYSNIKTTYQMIINIWRWLQRVACGLKMKLTTRLL